MMIQIIIVICLSRNAYISETLAKNVYFNSEIMYKAQLK